MKTRFTDFCVFLESLLFFVRGQSDSTLDNFTSTTLPNNKQEYTPGPVQICECGVIGNPHEKIVGGSQAEENEFPWMVGIGDKRRGIYCGGALINDRFVLTAAHCVNNSRMPELHLLIGERFVRSQAPRHKVSLILVHPMYDRQYYNDVALVKMETPHSFSDNVLPVCFARPGIDYTGHLGVVTGWGAIAEGGHPASFLRKVEIPISSMSDCYNAYGINVIYSSVICAYWQQGQKDACQGDSGGPLVWKSDNRWFLIGLVSWGHGCARPGYPAIYSRVDKYYRWIDIHTRGSEFCVGAW